MRRREFMALIGGAATWPFTATVAVSREQVHRLGFLGAPSASKYTPLIGALRAGLSDFGYVEGKNIAIEFRWADGDNSRLPALAKELVGDGIEVLITHGTPGTLAAKKATATLPIVMAVCGDAVAVGAVDSLAQPGGNVTGNTFFGPELAAKRVELLKECVPGLAKVTVLVNPRNPVSKPVLQAMTEAAARLNVHLQQAAVDRASQLPELFSSIAAEHAEAIAVYEDAITVANAKLIAELAEKHRLPLASFPAAAKAGALLGYGPDIPRLFRHAAYFVDAIIKGAKPASLPVEEPTNFPLVINMKTAKTIGLTVPPTLIARADEVIE